MRENPEVNNPEARRKRIWETDCILFHVVLCHSMEWRELDNLLISTGHWCHVALSEPCRRLYVYRIAHRHCHSANPLSLMIESRLNLQHRRWLADFSEMTPPAIIHRVGGYTWTSTNETAGILWAIATDPRQGLGDLQASLSHVLHCLYRIPDPIPGE